MFFLKALTACQRLTSCVAGEQKREAPKTNIDFSAKSCSNEKSNTSQICQQITSETRYIQQTTAQIFSPIVDLLFFRSSITYRTGGSKSVVCLQQNSRQITRLLLMWILLLQGHPEERFSPTVGLLCWAAIVPHQARAP